MTNNSVTNTFLVQIQAIFAMSSDCIMILDNMGTIIYLNNKAEHYFGNDLEKISGQPIGNLIPSFQLKQATGAEGFVCNAFNHKSESHPININVNSISIDQERFEVLTIVPEKGYFQDISTLNKELKEIKFALDESSIIAITDQTGIIYAANKKFCDLSKYSKEELIGEDHRILNSGYHPRGFFRDMWKTIGTGNVWRGEIRNRAKDGSFYWVHTTIVPLLNEQGKPYRYFSFRVDITEQKQIEADLQKALKDDFITTVKNLENGVFKMSKDVNGNLIYTMAEGKLLENLGLRTGSMKNKTPFEIFPIEIATYKTTKYKQAFLGSREHYEIELGGRLLYVDVSPIRQGEEVVELVGSVHDVTELRSTQKQLQENQLLYQSLYTLSQDAVFTLDKHDHVISVNPTTENLFGYTQEDIVQTSLASIIVGDYQKKYQLYFEKVLKGEPQNFDTAVYHKDGQIVHLNLTYLPISVDQGTMVIYSIGKDITRQKKAQELNAYLAHHDELTKLLNRRGFEGELKKAIIHAEKSNQKFAVMYVDLDRFKNVNDTLGHFIGDRLLEEIAFRLKSQIGEGNWIARMGGDEFMVLCPVNHQEDSIYVANKILHCLNEPFFIEENELYLTASVGISTYPKNGDNVIDLMKHADIALYKAKDLGRNNYQIYSNLMNQSRYQSFMMERDLRKALIHDEFIVHLQPRVDSITNKVISAEALIRWNHPKYGLISPKEFIPLAEETGIIIPIGKWMKRKVCEQLVKWQEAGKPIVPISINISAQRFVQKDFAYSVSQILQEFQLEGSLLEFEITENSLMKNEEDVVRTIHHLKTLGIKIYIDDFGTGYSSFSYLKAFKVDGIKIDRSFIRDISCQSENAGITSAMIQLAYFLKMEVIAEGVETMEELNFLHEHNCNQVQGFLFNKPLSIKEFEELYF